MQRRDEGWRASRFANNVDVTTRQDKTKRYRSGSVKLHRGRHEVRLPNGKGGYDFLGSYEHEEQARAMRMAALLVRGAAGLRTTVRQLGAVYLAPARQHHRAYKSERGTWDSVLTQAPFIDDAVEDLTRPQLYGYATKWLPEQRKRRSVLRDGKRELVVLEEPISRKYAQNAMQVLRSALELAVDIGMIESIPLTMWWCRRTAARSRPPSTICPRRRWSCCSVAARAARRRCWRRRSRTTRSW